MNLPVGRHALLSCSLELPLGLVVESLHICLAVLSPTVFSPFGSHLVLNLCSFVCVVADIISSPLSDNASPSKELNNIEVYLICVSCFSCAAVNCIQFVLVSTCIWSRRLYIVALVR